MPPLARTAFLVGVVLLAATIGWMTARDSFDPVTALGVRTMEPHFADVRTFTGARVALDRGLDPLVENPGDPWNRPLNYPRIWLLPAYLGVGPGQTKACAIAIFAAFLAGLLALAPLVRTPGTAALLLAIVFSPVAWLAVERANSDLLVVAILIAAARFAASRPAAAAFAVTTAAVLKLFPVFALPGLASGRRGSFRSVAVAAAVFVAYAIWIRADLPSIARNLQTWHPISYGITLMPRAAADAMGWSYAVLLTIAATALGAVAVLALRLRRRVRITGAQDAGAFAAFRVGAPVFVGTFCLGSNFDYRLLVLLLVGPQLVAWVRSARLRRPAMLAATTVVLTVWSATWRLALAPLPGGHELGLVLDEVLCWSLVCGLLVAFVLALPDAVLPVRFRLATPIDEPA
ncbi:MAG: hypothetical protein JNK78_14850 [Planctomycetes bacterium]|nr:hypothetical protein [Planctomycetota bacterium]